MKRFLKPLWIGLLIGAVELGAVGLMAGVGKWAAFEDLAFGFGIATLLLALLVLFSGRRVQAGMNISPNNAAAQTAFQAQVAYDEAKTMEKLPPLSGNAVRSVAVFVAAAWCWQALASVCCFNSAALECGVMV